MILLDSTVVVGFLDADDALHEAAVSRLRELAPHDVLGVSVVSYMEVMTGAKLGHHAEQRVAGFFDTLIGEPLPVDRSVAGRAATIRARRRSLRSPDALILATADLHENVVSVLCGDRDWPKVTGIDCRVELLGPA